MRVIGIDPSLNATGWAVVTVDGLLAAGRIPGNRSGWDKLSSQEKAVRVAREIGSVLDEQIAAAEEENDLIEVYQEQAHCRFLGAALPLAHLAGAICQEIAARGRRARLIHVKSWRKVLNLKTNGKEPTVAWAQAYLATHGLPFSSYSEDELEAIGIAEAGRVQLSREG